MKKTFFIVAGMALICACDVNVDTENKTKTDSLFGESRYYIGEVGRYCQIKDKTSRTGGKRRVEATFW